MSLMQASGKGCHLPAGQRGIALSLRPLLLGVSWGPTLEGELPDHCRRSFVLLLVRLLDLQRISDGAVMPYWGSRYMSCKTLSSWSPLPHTGRQAGNSSLSPQPSADC